MMFIINTVSITTFKIITKNCGIRSNDAMNNGTQHNDTQYDVTQHKNTQHINKNVALLIKTVSITKNATFIQMALSITDLSMIIKDMC